MTKADAIDRGFLKQEYFRLNNRFIDEVAEELKIKDTEWPLPEFLREVAYCWARLIMSN